MRFHDGRSCQVRDGAARCERETVVEEVGVVVLGLRLVALQVGRVVFLTHVAITGLAVVREGEGLIGMCGVEVRLESCGVRSTRDVECTAFHGAPEVLLVGIGDDCGGVCV